MAQIPNGPFWFSDATTEFGYGNGYMDGVRVRASLPSTGWMSDLMGRSAWTLNMVPGNVRNTGTAYVRIFGDGVGLLWSENGGPARRLTTGPTTWEAVLWTGTATYVSNFAGNTRYGYTDGTYRQFGITRVAGEGRWRIRIYDGSGTLRHEGFFYIESISQ